MSDNEYQRETAIADINRVLSGDFAKPRDLAQAWVNHRWLEDGKTLIFGERLRSLEICDLEKWIIDLIENGRLAAHSQSGIPAQKRQKVSLAQGADWQDFMHVSPVQFRAAFEEMQTGQGCSDLSLGGVGSVVDDVRAIVAPPVALTECKRKVIIEKLGRRFPALESALNRSEEWTKQCRVTGRNGWYYLELLEKECRARYGSTESVSTTDLSIVGQMKLSGR